MAVDNITTERLANLAVVNYEALANKDASEIEKLTKAAQTVGMWYVDLRGPKSETYFEDIPALFEIAHAFFNLPKDCDEKMKVIQEGTERGYDKMDRGYHTSVDYHYYEIAISEYMNNTWNLPKTIEIHRERLNRAIKTANDAAQLILAELCASVGATIPELTADLKRDSDTCFKLVYKPAVHSAGGIVIPWHTDFGILTFLWYDDPTTQIPVYDSEGKQTEEFETVGVKEGCVLVYVSDDLAEKTGGRLHPATHRVVAPPGNKREKNGQVYMIRPYKS